MTLAKIIKNRNGIANSMSELKKKFFELEVMQSLWEAQNTTLKPIKSGKEYARSIMKRI